MDIKNPISKLTDAVDDTKRRIIKLKTLGTQLKLAARMHDLLFEPEGVEYTTEQRQVLYNNVLTEIQELQDRVRVWMGSYGGQV